MKYRPTRPLRFLRFLARSFDEDGISGAIVDTAKHFYRSVRSRGLSGTFKNTFRGAPLSPEAAVPRQPHPFDLLHGTDTGGYISGGNLPGASLSALYSTAYLGIPPSALTPALSALPIRYQDFTFVDIGCGKGRALLIAAQFPFRHLLGIEIADELCDIARANIATSPEWVARISVFNQDATNLTYPEGPLLLYLYYPFYPPVLRRVLANLERDLRRSPRPTSLLYADNPRFAPVMSSFAFLREVSETKYPLTSEDIAHEPFHQTQVSFTLYSADLTHRL